MKISLVILSLFLVACQSVPVPPPPPPPPPIIQPFADNKAFMLVRDMQYDIFDSNESVVVPVGFVTDFASAPQALWSFGLSPHGRYSRAAVIHDFLYWAQICTREQADNIMLLAMMESGVNTKEQFLFYRGVDFGGNPSWRENKVDREKGLPRVVPEEYMYNIPHNATWDEWEQVLVRNNVKDPVFSTTAGYCRLGTDEYVAQKMKDMEEECKKGLNLSFCL